MSRNVLYRVEGSDVETSVAALLGGGVGPVACDDGELTRPVRERRGKRGKRGRGEEGEGGDAWEGEGEVRRGGVVLLDDEVVAKYWRQFA